MVARSAATLVDLALMLVSTQALAAGAASRDWDFEALLDGKPIGEHRFHVVGDADEMTVDSRAHFRVKAWLIPVYHYDHEDHEVWRSGCLVRIASQTDDNGHRLALHGALGPRGFELSGPHGRVTLPACVKTFAYWDQAALHAPRLLNSETGDYLPVTLTPEAPRPVQTRGQTVNAQYDTLAGVHLHVELWYSMQGDWLALQSQLASGHTLRYALR